MLRRLSPVPERLLGHAVHRAPDAERNQHPGDGAAEHAHITAAPCASVQPGDGEKSVPVQLSFTPLSKTPRSVRSSVVRGASVQVTTLWE